MRRKHWCILSGSRTGCKLIARGEHLAAIREHGICVESPSRTFTVTDIKAVDEAGYAEIPDVLFVCVKGYSIPDIIPFLREHSDAETLSFRS